MATIAATATCESHRRVLASGARRLADDALAECLERAQLAPADLDLLINAGVYREQNLAEPALASMIQEDVGVNPSRDAGLHGTFSFDVANGGCGVLTAIELVAGFIASKVIDVGAVVASDSDPGNAEHFPFPNAGGAVLLRGGPEGTGFVAFASETFPEHVPSFESVIAWHEREHVLPFRPHGHNALELTIGAGYPAAALECAARFARRFLAAQALGPGDVDLLVSADLARRLGLAPQRVALPEPRFAGAYTAGVIASLDAARASGRLAAARHALFVTVGPGISVAAALYRQPAPSPRPGRTPEGA
jgi:3-oxoacyl-[acyl-carrier-protein] synthase-3